MDAFTHRGMTFDLDDRGDPAGPPVIALHGFPSDRECWAGVGDRLGAQGYRVLAPEQRGYSPGASPPGRRSYLVDDLARDVVALADQAGADRFHLVGHDWGAVVAWHLAATRPDRVATLTAVSVPHPDAFARSLLRSDQALRSWYMLGFQVPRLPERLMGRDGGEWLRRSLRSSGLPDAVAQRYAARAARGAMTGPLNWYRALPLRAGRRTGRVRVPTAMVWSPGDSFCARAGVEATVRMVDAPYRLLELPASGTHWLPEVMPGAVAEAVADLARAHPIAR